MTSSPPPPDRYAEKPMYMLLDCYVLWSIGELSDELDAKLTVITPSLKSAFKVDGDDWRQIVAAGMQLPDDFSDEVRRLWRDNVERFEAAGARAVPLDFARAFVDEAFPL